MNSPHRLNRSLLQRPLRAPIFRRSFAALVGTFDALVTCQPGLEPVLSQELQSLGIQHVQSNSSPLPGIAIPRASIDDLYSCHLHLGTASRILLRCCPDFSARALGELQRKLAPGSSSKSAWWLDTIAQHNATIQVKAVARKSRLYHTGAIEERVMESIKRAVGSRATVVDHRKPGSQLSIADPRNRKQANASTLNFHVSVFRDVVSIWMDTSSSPLHQRGYRLQTAKAPLREDLSFALLYCAGWRPATRRLRLTRAGEAAGQASGSPSRSLLDPFCGSGTIVIEAAAMACGLPPGRLRPPPFGGTNMHDPTRWQNLVSAGDNQIQREQVGCMVHGSDRDEGAVAIAAANARRAGVLDAIDLRHCAFSSHPFLEEPDVAPKSLLIASNPPFGRRISASSPSTPGPLSTSKEKRRRDTSPLLPLYQRLSDRVKCLMRRPECSTNDVSMVLLTDDHALIQNAFPGWRHDVALRTSHGGIPVEFISVCVS